MNTKVILNQDIASLGEEGDVKHVARGFARNFLFPRGLALPFNASTQKLFEARKDEIELRKVQKRKDAAGIKERLEADEIKIVMPAGANGKLYGAVTTQTLASELASRGFDIERKKIEIAGNTIKNAGKHKVVIKLYDNSAAEISVTVEAQKVEEEKSAERKARSSAKHEEEAASEAAAEGTTSETSESAVASESAAVEA